MDYIYEIIDHVNMSHYPTYHIIEEFSTTITLRLSNAEIYL